MVRTRRSDVSAARAPSLRSHPPVAVSWGPGSGNRSLPGLHGPTGQRIKPSRPAQTYGSPSASPRPPPFLQPAPQTSGLPGRPSFSGCREPVPSPSPLWRQLLLTPCRRPRTKFKFQSLRLVTHRPDLRTIPSPGPFFSKQRSPPAGEPLLPRDPTPRPNAAPPGALALKDPRLPRRDPLPRRGAFPQHRPADVSAPRHFSGDTPPRGAPATQRDPTSPRDSTGHWAPPLRVAPPSAVGPLGGFRPPARRSPLCPFRQEEALQPPPPSPRGPTCARTVSGTPCTRRPLRFRFVSGSSGEVANRRQGRVTSLHTGGGSPTSGAGRG